MFHCSKQNITSITFFTNGLTFYTRLLHEIIKICHTVLYGLYCILLQSYLDRSSRPEVFCKKSILRNFEKFTGKHLYQGLCYSLSLVVSLVVTCYTTHCHSLPIVIIGCHLLYYSLQLVVTRFRFMYHSISRSQRRRFFFT